jgi:hypothetical protein
MNLVDVTRAASTSTKCITVDAPSHVYLAGRTFIPTHNSNWDVNALRQTMQDVLGPDPKTEETPT